MLRQCRALRAGALVKVGVGVAVFSDTSTTCVAIVVISASGLAALGSCTPTIPLKSEKVQVHLAFLCRRNSSGELYVSGYDVIVSS